LKAKIGGRERERKRERSKGEGYKLVERERTSTKKNSIQHIAI